MRAFTLFLMLEATRRKVSTSTLAIRSLILRLTSWRRTFFQILAHSVFKM